MKSQENRGLLKQLTMNDLTPKPTSDEHKAKILETPESNIKSSFVYLG